jgi:GT2 family glycosyltransferase
MNLDLSIVTVNWKVAHLVSEMLDSVARETRGIAYDIYVVDNASGDTIASVVEAFRAAHPSIPLHFIQNEANLGFAAANNIAVRLAGGRHIVLLNPDTRVTDGALQKMVAWLDAHRDVGVAGPKLLNPDGTIQPSVRRLPTLIDQTLILLKLHHLLPWLPPLKEYLAADFDYEKEQAAEQVMGAAFFVRREVFERIGLLDERYFIWMEEVDFCKRARDNGWRVAYAPVASIVHHGGTSFAQVMDFRKQKYYADSLMKYMRKHHGARRASYLALPVLIGLGAAASLSLWRFLHKPRS